MRRTAIAISAALLAACNQQTAQNQPAANAPEPPPPAEPPSPPEANATLPDDRTPLAEPAGPIDPKSTEAAGQVAQHYGALIEQKRFAEAAKLWGSAADAAIFSSQLTRNRENHLEIGNLGAPEGAAGSIYVTMPVVFYGIDPNGKPFRNHAEIVLRRVNDVPGSTEAQRRWHIERIERKGA